jgi:hypothetical protein
VGLLVLLLGLGAVLGRDPELSVADRHVDVLRLEAGDVGDHDDLVVRVGDVDVDAAAGADLLELAAEVGEPGVQLFEQFLDLLERVASSTHVSTEVLRRVKDCRRSGGVPFTSPSFRRYSTTCSVS